MGKAASQAEKHNIYGEPHAPSKQKPRVSGRRHSPPVWKVYKFQIRVCCPFYISTAKGGCGLPTGRIETHR